MPGKPLGLTYSRISDPNDERTASLESQEEASVALLESRGFRVPPEYRLREQYTGMESIYDRPVLDRVRELIASGAVQAFACYDTDRLAREPSELLTVVRDAHQRKVEPLFVRMDHETRGRVGEMLTFMKGWASALEWDAIRDRTMRGRMKIYQNGQWVGHGRVRYGHQWDKATRTRTPHPEHSLIVIRIFEQVAAGVSTADVADSLSRDGIPTPRVSSAREKGIRECIVSTKWSSSTIRDLIREPTHKGVCRGRLTMPGNRRRKNRTRLMVPRPDDQKVALKDPRTTPLVSDELWEKANRALTARRNREPSRRIPNPDFMLYGPIFGGREGCGCRMTGIHQKNTWGGHSRMYRCSGNAGNRLHRNGCVRTLGAIWLEANVCQKVTDIIMTPGLLERKLAEIEVSKVGETIQSDLKAAIDRRNKISKHVKPMLEAQAETSSKLLLTALKEKPEVLDKEAGSLYEHIYVLKQLRDAYENSASAIRGLKAMIASLREHTRLDSLTIPEEREVLVGLGVTVRAWPRETDVKLDIKFKLDNGHNTAGIPGNTAFIARTPTWYWRTPRSSRRHRRGSCRPAWVTPWPPGSRPGLASPAR